MNEREILRLRRRIIDLEYERDLARINLAAARAQAWLWFLCSIALYTAWALS